MESQKLQVIIYNKDFDFRRQIYNFCSDLQNINIIGVAKSTIELRVMLEQNDLDILIVSEKIPEFELFSRQSSSLYDRIKSIIDIEHLNGSLNLKCISVFADKFANDNDPSEYEKFYNEILRFSVELNNKFISGNKQSSNNGIEEPKHIANILDDFGIHESLKGYVYLIDAVILISKESKISQDIYNMIFMEISNRYNTTIIRVVKTIHHAIDVAWNNSGKDIKEKYFKAEAMQRPSDQDFILFLLEDYIIFKKNCSKNFSCNV